MWHQTSNGAKNFSFRFLRPWSSMPAACGVVLRGAFLSVLFFLTFGAGAAFGASAIGNTYNGVTGVMSLPAVQVGSGVYAVTFLNTAVSSGGLAFALTGIDENTYPGQLRFLLFSPGTLGTLGTPISTGLPVSPRGSWTIMNSENSGNLVSHCISTFGKSGLFFHGAY